MTRAARRSGPGDPVSMTAPDSRSPELARRRWLPWALGLGAALSAGAFLRLWRLGSQVLVVDELHRIRAILSLDWPEILVTYGRADHCLPLAGFARYLLEHGQVLTEPMLRGPSVVAGLALLVLMPLWAAERLGRTEALLLTWLVALAPGLVFYSRIARSYAPAVLLAVTAAALFERWWRRRTVASAIGAALSGALAVYFHPGMAPTVAAPFGFAVLEKLLAWRRGEGGLPRWREVAGVGAALLAGMALFLVPGWSSFSEVLAAKGGGGHFTAHSIRAALVLQAGSRLPALTVLFWLLAAWGLVALAHRRPVLARFTAILVLTHCCALAVFVPAAVANPVVLNRYLLPLLPVVLVWVAQGLAALGPTALPAVPRRWLVTAVAVLFLGLMTATGPFVRPRFRYSSFVHHDDFLAFYRPLPSLERDRVPAFYRTLSPRGGPLLELPAFPEGTNRALHAYQDHHRRDVLLSVASPLLADRRSQLATLVSPRPDRVLSSGARYLVLHLDLGAEERSLEIPPSYHPPWTQRTDTLAERYRKRARSLIEVYERLWGPPDLVGGEPQLRVWDLERVRRERERTQDPHRQRAGGAGQR